jgi:hypothetical protein
MDGYIVISAAVRQRAARAEGKRRQPAAQSRRPLRIQHAVQFRLVE